MNYFQIFEKSKLFVRHKWRKISPYSSVGLQSWSEIQCWSPCMKDRERWEKEVDHPKSIDGRFKKQRTCI